ncbi:MAG TPA: SCO family protein [Chthoniobacterales bacterium]|jgi:protein SCO1/2|nr:SCO family protein [Chthoniobacterales bacterium]
MKRASILLFAIALSAIRGFTQDNDPAADPNRQIRFEQHLDRSVSSTLEFSDESGNLVNLRNFFVQRPIVLAMGYYQCPMLCGVVLNALVQSLQDFPANSPNRDFNFIFVSIDPKETAQLAKAKRQTYLARYGWGPAGTRWHFLTGPESSIHQLADEIGFRYRYDAAAHQFVHPSGLVFLTPSGRISSYLLGIEYPQRDLAQAIVRARQGQVASPVQQILLLCFSGNGASGSVASLVLIALRIGAFITLLGLVILIRLSRRRAKKEPVA